MLISAFLFVPVFLFNLAHLRYRKIPIYSWGTVIAVFHICAGVIWFIFLPVAAILVSVIIEIVNSLMTQQERDSLNTKYEQEIISTEQNIELAQKSYENFFCICSFTAEQEWEFRKALKILEDNGIWNYVRNGLITSILIKNEDQQKAEKLLWDDAESNESIV